MRLSFGNSGVTVETDLRMRNLNMIPALDGIRIDVPVTIDFPPKTMLSEVRIDLFLDIPNEGRTLVSQARINFIACPWNEGKNLLSELHWPLSFTQLAIVEKNRANADLSLFALADAMIGDMDSRHSDSNPFPFDVTSLPNPDRSQGWLVIPADQWEAARKKACSPDSVVVTIPRPSAEPEPWAWVLDALVEARQNFDRGGAPAWNACVASVRKGIEYWWRIQKLGDGKMEAILRKGAEERSREERLLVIIKSLRDFCNQAHHTLAEGESPIEIWTREDAQFAVATFASLIAKRQKAQSLNFLAVP